MIEPLQRIPRYRLLMNNIMKEMPTSSVQYQRLHEASSLAGHIASREVNNSTRRAAILWSCSKAIEKFPEELASSRRELLGCIDVEELVNEAHASIISALGSVLGRKRTLGFSLLIFDDLLVLAQRHSQIPTHQILRVQEPEKLIDMMQTEQSRSPAPNRKTELSFAGMVDLGNVLATGLNGSEARFALLAPLRGSSNKAMTRVFTDANASRDVPRMALFLDCLWKAQVVYRARSRALQVRASTMPAHGERPAHAMLWTIMSPSQFQRFPYKRNLLFQIGSVASAMQLQATYHIDVCVNIELLPDEDKGTVTLLRANGAHNSSLLALKEIPSLCADLCCGLVSLPENPEPRELPPVEVPVRRARSLRTPSRRAPGAHRTRSFMSERVRASIQSSLEAVMESQELEAQQQQEQTTPGHKRGMPLGEISNLTPKRRAVSEKSHADEKVPTEEELVEEYRRMDTEPEYQLETSSVAASIERTPSRNALTMRAEESKELPNPFEAEAIEVHGAALVDSEQTDEAEVEAQLEEPVPEPVKSFEQEEPHLTASNAEGEQEAPQEEVPLSTPGQQGLEPIQEEETQPSLSKAPDSIVEEEMQMSDLGAQGQEQVATTPIPTPPPKQAEIREEIEEEEMLAPAQEEGETRATIPEHEANAQVAPGQEAPATHQPVCHGDGLNEQGGSENAAENLDPMVELAEEFGRPHEFPHHQESSRPASLRDAESQAGPEAVMTPVDAEQSQKQVSFSSERGSPNSEHPPSIPMSRTASGASNRPVTEEEMQELLRPLLGHLQNVPMPQHAERGEANNLPMPQRAEIEGREQDMDLTVLRLLHEEQEREADIPPVPAMPEIRPNVPETPLLPSQPSGLPKDNESLAMKRAMVRVNEAIAALRKHRPPSQARGWQEDWAQFKQAVKIMNVCWTRMERSYEDKQMDLAALHLAQNEKDPNVRISAEEYMSLQDEANMVASLRIQVEQLSQKVESLMALEQDTRMENAELYNVRCHTDSGFQRRA